jgi:hypothetical protein
MAAGFSLSKFKPRRTGQMPGLSRRLKQVEKELLALGEETMLIEEPIKAAGESVMGAVNSLYVPAVD